MSERHDHDLGERFHALRREQAATAPQFRAMLAAARAGQARRPHRRALGLAAAAIVLAGVAAGLFLGRAGRHRMTIDLATARWQAPTDFLLALPGEELLRTVPELGRVSVSGFTITSDRRTP